MNGAEVKKHLESFIANNDRETLGASDIQRDCKISYSNAFRVLQLGVKKGLFNQDEIDYYKFRMVSNEPI